MSTGQQHKTWGVADFERYHSGKMTETEMHALEKAALDDPFLEDALEGYAFTKTPVADIDLLKEKLFAVNTVDQDADEKTPVVWFRRKAVSQLFKAAAIIIIFAGLGYFILNRNNKEEGEAVTNIASVETKMQKDSVNSLYNINDTAPIIAKLDDAKVEEIVRENKIANAPVASEQAQLDYNINAPAEQDDLRRNANVMKDKQGIVPPAVQNAKVSGVNVRPQQAPVAKEERALFNQNQSEIRGRVVDNSGNAVPFATVRNNADSRQQAVSADINGNFSLQNNTPSNNAVNVEVNATGYETAKSNLTNNAAENTIVLNQSPNQVSEVVVTAMNAKKAKPNDTNTYADKAGREKYFWSGRNSYIQLRNATPLQGWPYFY
ncbi:MAG: carboxypeptidase regulatory-like domain-containing protein, partial [Sphingobacteriales bacterium]